MAITDRIRRTITSVSERMGGGWERLQNRLALWKNTAVAAYTQGQLDAPVPAGRDEPHFLWTLGSTEEHCADCLAFAGAVLSQSEWARLPSPQSPDLECGGWHCDCRLIPVDGARTGMPEIGID